MSISQDAGRVIVAGFPEGPPPASLLAMAERDALGGFILFRRNVTGCQEVAALNRQLRDTYPEAACPLIAVDQEGGRVARIGPPLLQLPSMRVLGAIDDPDLTEALAFTLGKQLAALGFNVDMAPVLDVDSNPDNPVIGDRSFGDSPDRVIRHGRAVTTGLQRARVAACGKHFPGHGDTDVDSHLELPRLPHARARLDAIELRPFAALASDLASIMSAHVVFEAIAPRVPATLAGPVMTGLLRDELGFEGVVFSDDMEMKAIAERYGAGDAACAAIEAGCDAVLICSEPDRALAVHAALSQRAEGDAAFAARLSQAAARVQALGRRFACQPLPPAGVAALLSDQAAQRLADTLAQRISGASPPGA